MNNYWNKKLKKLNKKLNNKWNKKLKLYKIFKNNNDKIDYKKKIVKKILYIIEIIHLKKNYRKLN